MMVELKWRMPENIQNCLLCGSENIMVRKEGKQVIITCGNCKKVIRLKEEKT